MLRNAQLLKWRLILIGAIVLLSNQMVDAQKKPPPIDEFLEDPFSGNYNFLKLGYQQLDGGFISGGIKFVQWENAIFFKSHTLEYGYSPWEKLHLMKYNADLTLSFVNFGLEMSSVTNGEQFNVEFRPQLGVYFVYFGAYFGPNLWVNDHFKDRLNRWVFNLEVNIPLWR